MSCYLVQEIIVVLVWFAILHMRGTDWYGILVMYDMTIHAPWVLQEENVVGMFWGSWLHSYNCGPLKRHK